MQIGDNVVIEGTDTLWDGKSGTLESIDERRGRCVVLVDFVPGEDKLVRQDFDLQNVKSI